MNAYFTPNLGKLEKTLRWIIGGSLIMAVLTNAYTTIWFALLGTYPILTAILAWDPCYAALNLSKTTQSFRSDRFAGQLSG